MDRAEYVGALEELKGLTALVRPDPGCPEDAPLAQRTLLAQFDGKDDWRLGPEHKLRHPETGAFLCQGWHSFPVTDFRLLVEVRW